MRPKNFGLSAKVTLMTLTALTILTLALWFLASKSLLQDAQSRASERQATNMKVAWDVLHQYGEPLHVENGHLIAGTTILNDFFEPVDRVKRLVGGTATIFMGDKRITTNVIKPDGSRAIGTLLAKGPVYDAVLTQGHTYRGEADILGTPYFTAYDPIVAPDGAVIGVLYVGIPKADFLAGISALQMELLIGSLGVTILAGAACFLIARKLFSPLKNIGTAMQRLAAGDTSVSLPWADRNDDIGQMAKSVVAFQRDAIEKRRLELEAKQSSQSIEDMRIRDAMIQTHAAENQSNVVNCIAKGLSRLSDGDLTTRVDQAFPPDYDRLRVDFNAAVGKLQETMKTILSNSSAILSGSDDMSSATAEIARRIEQQAASLEETAAALNEITETVRQTAAGSKHAANLVGTAKQAAEASGEVVSQAMTAMSDIETSSGEIGQIIGVIDEIAFQTNLLALNAGVEAARAGEAGRGFAVVASEVRALAQRSADAAKQIKALVSTSIEQVRRGVDLVDQTGTSLKRILVHVDQVNGIVAEIAASAQDQATNLVEINSAVNHMDQATQRNAAMIEESATSSRALTAKSEDLSRLIGLFQLGRQESAATHRGRRAA